MAMALSISFHPVRKKKSLGCGPVVRMGVFISPPVWSLNQYLNTLVMTAADVDSDGDLDLL